MIAILDGLSPRLRLVSAGLILVIFAAALVVPAGLGAASLSQALQSRAISQDATAQIEQRLTAFEARRMEVQSEHAISDAAYAALLDPVAGEAVFRARLDGFANALRDRGLTVSGEARILVRDLPGGMVLLSADIAVVGPLSQTLEVLVEPQFADLRTQGASFAAQNSPDQVRGAFRFVQYHVATPEER